MVAGVHDANDGAEGQRGVGRRGGIHIVGLAVRGGLAVKVFSVPAGDALPDRQRLHAILGSVEMERWFELTSCYDCRISRRYEQTEH